MPSQTPDSLHWKAIQGERVISSQLFFVFFLDDKNEIDKLMWLMKDEKASLQ